MRGSNKGEYRGFVRLAARGLAPGRTEHRQRRPQTTPGIEHTQPMIRSSLTRKAVCLLILFLYGAPSPGSAQPGTRDIMANAMSRMMEAMGMFDSNPAPQSGSGMPADPMAMMGPLGAAGWGSGSGMPWGSPFQDPSRAFAMGEMMKQFAHKMPAPGGPASTAGGWQMPWSASQLEGIWEGRNGELLIVQGNRFRIYSPGMQRVDGLIEIRGDRLALYNPQDEHAQPFEFAESQGRMVMRDQAGQTYLYRRLRLDGGQPDTPPREPLER